MPAFHPINGTIRSSGTAYLGQIRLLRGVLGHLVGELRRQRRPRPRDGPGQLGELAQTAGEEHWKKDIRWRLYRVTVLALYFFICDTENLIMIGRTVVNPAALESGQT